MKNIFYTFLLNGFCSFLAIGQIPTPDPCIDGTQQTCRCESAPVLCTIDDLDGYEFAMSDFQHPEDGPDLFCGDPNSAPDNPTWFSFVAWCASLELEVEIENCNEVCLTGGPCNFLCNLLGNCSSGVQIAIFGDCNYNEVVACSVDDCGNENTKQLSIPNLTIGETYHFVIDGCGGSSCDRVQINVIGSCGTQQIEEWSNPLTGPEIFCSQDTVIFQSDSLDGAATYYWFLDGILLDSSDIPEYPLFLPDTGSYQLCVDVSNLPCVPITNQPESLCRTIQVIAPDLQALALNSRETCPGDTVVISMIRTGNLSEWTNLIWVEDQDNQVLAVSDTEMLSFSHNQCDSFIAYGLQYLDSALSAPEVGSIYNLPDCNRSCCNLFREVFIFTDMEAPIFNNLPEDVMYSCLEAVPELSELSYTDNCIGFGTVLGNEIGRDRIVDTGTWTRTWMVADACNNSSMHQQRISIPSAEAFTLTLSPPFAEALSNEIVRVEANTSLQAEAIGSVDWFPAMNLSCSECLITEIRADEDELFTLVVTDTFGCREEIQFQLTIREPDIEIYIPNTFTPNGDGINDGFTLFSNAIFQEVDLMIFDRWGSRVFYTNSISPNNESSGWDGTIRGRPADSGVYIYSFRLYYADGSTETVKGDVWVAP